jgi:preprotein translocase subunit YajC
MDLLSLLFPLLIAAPFVLLIVSGRRQRRQQLEMQQLQASLETGDVVMTTSGLRGTVTDASYEDTVDIEIADGVITTWVRAAIREKIVTDVDGPADGPADDAAATDDATGTGTGTGTAGGTAGTAAAGSTTDDAPAAAPSLEKDDSANGSSAR